MRNLGLFLGTDLTINTHLAVLPTSKERFTFRNSDYKNIKLSLDSKTEAKVPTIIGSNTPADVLPELSFLNEKTGKEVVRLTALTGLGIKEKDEYILSQIVIPSVSFQIGLGIVKDTELKIRYVPKNIVKVNRVDYKLFGIGNS